jgi:hypothetical protein
LALVAVRRALLRVAAAESRVSFRFRVVAAFWPLVFEVVAMSMLTFRSW